MRDSSSYRRQSRLTARGGSIAPDSIWLRISARAVKRSSVLNGKPSRTLASMPSMTSYATGIRASPATPASRARSRFCAMSCSSWRIRSSSRRRVASRSPFWAAREFISARCCSCIRFSSVFSDSTWPRRLTSSSASASSESCAATGVTVATAANASKAKGARRERRLNMKPPLSVITGEMSDEMADKNALSCECRHCRRRRFHDRDWKVTEMLQGLVGWLAGWLVGWLAGWLVGWLVGWLLLVLWEAALAPMGSAAIAAGARSHGNQDLRLQGKLTHLSVGRGASFLAETLYACGSRPAGERNFPTSDFRLPTSDFRLPTSDFRLPTSDFRPPIPILVVAHQLSPKEPVDLPVDVEALSFAGNRVLFARIRHQFEVDGLRLQLLHQQGRVGEQHVVVGHAVDEQ